MIILFYYITNLTANFIENVCGEDFFDLNSKGVRNSCLIKHCQTD